MGVSFEGFPRLIERDALRPGRWFVAAEGARPLICFSTDEGADRGDRLIITFGSTRPESLDVAPVLLKDLPGPLGSLEHDLVFTPGLGGPGVQLVAPARRAFRAGALLRLTNGDLGLGFAAPGGALSFVSLVSGLRADTFEFVFDRWSLSLRRGANELLVGRFKPV